ncbi:hypothetical protein [Salinispora vitiensis]|uniref:hypothetical protein n=1 Tax=Salinispora vitiensis TaxID=999544 RepID=UPI00039D93B9|nr:hypothetical protein [Salinispora vitiensis]
MLSFEINPIGTVRNDRTDVQHTDNWGAVHSTITIDERFGEACLQGLEGFTHVDVLFISIRSRNATTTASLARTAAVLTSRPSESSPVAVPADRTALG